jgi:glycosyltransferase involved in cell wall biosynthesis
VASPRVSVFTPSHHPRFLDDCLRSLLAQTLKEWEWVVVLNQGARWRPLRADRRVRVIVNDELNGVGATKRCACSEARGEILVELDHDDELRSDALELIVKAFDHHPDVGFVYSNTAQIAEDGRRDDSRWNEANGWVYSDVDVDGRTVLQVQSLEPSPHNVSYIWYAPNHVRAFRNSIYQSAGGYDSRRDVLDDQDLMCRMYQLAAFHHIEQCLYLQRVHQKSTQRDAELNARIQVETVQLYDRYIDPCALAWAQRRGLTALDLGAAHHKRPGYLGVDRYPGVGVDIVADVTEGIDLPDSSVGVIRAVDFLPQIPDKISLFNELYRLLAHGGLLLSHTASTDGRGAYQDPTHVAYYNENSFWYFTNRDYARFVPQINCRFQVSRLHTYFADDWHRDHNIPYVGANLIAIKEGPRQGGILTI